MVMRHSLPDLLIFPSLVAYLPIAHNGTFHLCLPDADTAGPELLQLWRSTSANGWVFKVFSKPWESGASS